MQKKMFNLANLFTGFNMLSGIAAIFCVMSGYLHYAPLFVFIGAILDFFDGFIARALKTTGELGKQLDSFADMVTFGLAPGFIMLNCIILSMNLDQIHDFGNFIEFNAFQLEAWKEDLVTQGFSKPINMIPFLGFFISFMSMFRLAKFNLDTRQSDKFIGLPTPINTIFFCFFPIFFFFQFDILKGENWQNYLFNTYTLLGFVLIFSILLVSELPLLALKFKGFGWQTNKIKFIFLGICLLSLILFPYYSILIIFTSYFLASIIENKLEL